MTTGEIIKNLITSDNYAIARSTISDEFIQFVREMLPNDYMYIAEKEEAYQKLIELINSSGLS